MWGTSFGWAIQIAPVCKKPAPHLWGQPACAEPPCRLADQKMVQHPRCKVAPRQAVNAFGKEDEVGGALFLSLPRDRARRAKAHGRVLSPAWRRRLGNQPRSKGSATLHSSPTRWGLRASTQSDGPARRPWSTTTLNTRYPPTGVPAPLGELADEVCTPSTLHLCRWDKPPTLVGAEVPRRGGGQCHWP